MREWIRGIVLARSGLSVTTESSRMEELLTHRVE